MIRSIHFWSFHNVSRGKFLIVSTSERDEIPCRSILWSRKFSLGSHICEHEFCVQNRIIFENFVLIVYCSFLCICWQLKYHWCHQINLRCGNVLLGYAHCKFYLETELQFLQIRIVKALCSLWNLQVQGNSIYCDNDHLWFRFFTGLLLIFENV